MSFSTLVGNLGSFSTLVENLGSFSTLVGNLGSFSTLVGNLPPDHVDLEGVLSVNEFVIRQDIRSFPKCSAGGPDCHRPQHLLVLTSSTAGLGGVSLLCSLTAFTNLILSGNTPVVVRPFLFGASLVALKKRDGRLRRIAPFVV